MNLSVFIVLCTLPFFMVRIHSAFSPAAFGLLSYFLFFSQQFLTELNYLEQIACILAWGFVSLFILNEPVGVAGSRNNNMKFSLDKKILLGFSLMTILSVFMLLVQVRIYQIFGGIENYFASLVFRTVEHKGILLYKLITRQIFIVFYIAIVFVFVIRRKTVIVWVMFAVISLCFIVIAASQGSRSIVLFPLIYILFTYHRCVKIIKLRYALLSLPLGVFSTAFLEVWRKGFDLEEIDFSNLSFKFMDYGIFPVRLYFESGKDFISFGENLISAITNFIPSKFLSYKPRTGGTILNDVYADGAWPTSSITTGIWVDLMISFGVFLGTIIVPGILFLSVVMSQKYYSKWLRNRGTFEDFALIHVGYFLVVNYLTNLLVSEFAQATSVLIMSLITLYMLIQLLKVRI